MGDRAPPTVLIAAIGNPDRGDDGFGSAVAARLCGRLPVGARLVLCAGDVLGLIDEWKGMKAVVMIDAAASAGYPGRVHRLDLGEQPYPTTLANHSTHAFGVAEAVELARSLRRLPPRLIVYLVEGEHFEIGAPLSLTVAAAVARVAACVLREVCAVSRRDVAANGVTEHA